MGMSFYTYREDHSEPVCSFGPVDEMTALYSPHQTRLDATDQQQLEAGWMNGPHLSNSNAAMVLRSLNIECDDGAVCLDANDLKGRLLTALAVGGNIADDGQPTISSLSESGATMVQCGVRPGYFESIYGQVLEVCEQALLWQQPVLVA